MSAPQLVVVGDIHAQVDKFWQILSEAGVAHHKDPSPALRTGQKQLVLLGDLVHAKTHAQYAALIGQPAFDAYHPPDVARAEAAQEAFLRDVKRFSDAAFPHVSILMGNHDHNALTRENSVLRSGELAHLEWQGERALPPDLRAWLSSWPYELSFEGVHLAHVGPRPEHNRYDQSFYADHRRDWVLEDHDFLAQTPYRLGIYGHTPVRGGAHFASRGRALLLDMNTHGDEYAYLTLEVRADGLQVGLHGYFLELKLA